jgi:hypothetical protein
MLEEILVARNSTEPLLAIENEEKEALKDEECSTNSN